VGDSTIQDEEVPYGTCHCGCGRKTTLVTRTDSSTGKSTSTPRRFLQGHNGRKRVRHIEAETGYATPCWIWQLAKSKDGYGHERASGDKTVLAHRRYFEERHGPIPVDLQLDHLCRVPGCVNPDHMEAVTAAENVRRGSNTKLTAEIVRWVRRSNEKQAILARRFGVDQSHISRIRNGHTWRDID
jgi:hypothetical protein